MKKVFITSFLILGIILVSGCNINKQTSVNNQSMSEQITILEEQVKDLNSEIEVLKNENEKLKKDIKPSTLSERRKSKGI